MLFSKHFGTAATLFVSIVSSLPAPGDYPSSAVDWQPFDDVTIFSPTPDYTTPRVLYTRTELIGDTILATWENYSPEPPAVYFPIFKSTDGGLSWEHISNVTDQVNGWGLRYQPVLYVLPCQIGDYPAGTLLLSGSSIPTDLSQTKIEVYASRDDGYTWEFVSNVASGGRAEPTNGIPAIWEPFLMIYNSQLVLYFSDQRDPDHGQKLVHTTSTDLLTWSPLVDDVAYPTYTDRPGMTTVTQLPTGEYMMTYEYGGGPNADGSTTYRFPVYYRLNTDPLDFNNSPGIPLIAQDGTQPTGSPYITWSPAGGENGTIVVSSGDSADVFINKALGHESEWVRVATNAPSAYTRSLRVMPDPSIILITGAGHLPPSNNTAVVANAIEI